MAKKTYPIDKTGPNGKGSPIWSNEPDSWLMYADWLEEHKDPYSKIRRNRAIRIAKALEKRNRTVLVYDYLVYDGQDPYRNYITTTDCWSWIEEPRPTWARPPYANRYTSIWFPGRKLEEQGGDHRLRWRTERWCSSYVDVWNDIKQGKEQYLGSPGEYPGLVDKYKAICWSFFLHLCSLTKV